jgi:hypothetical protein
MVENGAHGDSVKVRIYFVSGDHITQLPTVVAGQVVTERNILLLFACEIDNEYCDALLAVEKK